MKTKARPVKAGTKLTATERANVLEMAEILKDLGSSPTDLLERAMKAEHLFRSSGGDVLPFLREFGGVGLYAPSVLAAISRAAAVCSALPDDMREVSRTFSKSMKLLGALFLKHESTVEMDRRDRVRAVLSLANAVQAEAERLAKTMPAANAGPDGRPNRHAITKARLAVASRIEIPATKTLPKRRLSIEGLEKRIRDARDLAPDAGWPEIMPERRGNRRA